MTQRDIEQTRLYLRQYYALAPRSYYRGMSDGAYVAFRFGITIFDAHNRIRKVDPDGCIRAGREPPEIEADPEPAECQTRLKSRRAINFDFDEW